MNLYIFAFVVTGALCNVSPNLDPLITGEKNKVCGQKKIYLTTEKGVMHYYRSDVNLIWFENVRWFHWYFFYNRFPRYSQILHKMGTHNSLMISFTGISFCMERKHEIENDRKFLMTDRIFKILIWFLIPYRWKSPLN